MSTDALVSDEGPAPAVPATGVSAAPEATHASAPTPPRSSSAHQGALGVIRVALGIVLKVVKALASILSIVIFPPNAFLLLARISFRLFKRFWIFPLEPFQLAGPAIAAGPILCLLTLYGFPEPLAAFLFTIVYMYVFYAACSDSPWEGARSFVQWAVIASLGLALAGSYFQVPVVRVVWQWVVDFNIPFPARLILFFSGIFYSAYFTFMIYQMVMLRITVKGKSFTVSRFLKEVATHALDSYEMKSFWHDANEAPFGCRGVKFIPKQPSFPPYEFEIVAGGVEVVSMINQAKGLDV